MHTSFLRALFGAAASIVLLVAPVSAHEHRDVGRIETVVGWLDEPAFADTVNGVSFRASHDEGPVTGARLKVDVTFGSVADVLTLTLSPAGDPGQYTASFVPTRAGAYSFRVYGTLDGAAFNQTFASGPKTFDEIESSADLQFPKEDPSRGELADKGVQVDRRIAALKVEVGKAGKRADAAWIALAGVMVGMIGLGRKVRARKAA